MAVFPRPTAAAVSAALPLLLTLTLLPGCHARQTATPPALLVPPAPLWTDAERADCVAFWSRPHRTQVSFLPARAALTPEASLWFSAFGRAVKTAPTAEAPAWKAWADAKFAHDQWEASALAGVPSPGPEPAAPGVIPAALLLAAGDPPPLSAALVPRRYTIDLGDGPPLTYVAPIPISPRYRYFRFAEGVISEGTPLRSIPDAEISRLMQAAGLTPFETHVVTAVSRLEGGFDAVNTYDTGFVSVGFIQFITAAGGDGSLATVLATEKAADPADFTHDFHRLGIDVTPGGLFSVVDPATGAALTGAEAVRETIRDPRLVGVFQTAGQHSPSFRTAQIQTAKRGYYPAEDPLTVTLGDGTVLTGRVADVLKSEAGMATAFDRKVNTGHAAPEVAAATAAVMTAHGLKSLADAAPYEHDIVAAIKYRADFLADYSLTQPPAPPASPPPTGPNPAATP